MTSPDQVRSCPDPEELSAYIDGTADADVREKIARHLLTCDECLYVMGTANRYRREHAVDRLPRYTWAVAASVTIALLTGVLALMIRRNDPVRELAATTRRVGIRTFEGRLTGFDPVPFRAPRATPETPVNPALAAAAKGVLADGKPESATDWHARGVAYLILERPADAVSAMARAVEMAPESAVYRSDLAAARIALGTAGPDAEELRRAVADADVARRLDRSFAAAAFNRAVAVGRLGQTAEASRAWAEYLALDGGSPWADEARWRLEHLRK